MNFSKQARIRFKQFNILEKLITINVIFFVFPFLLKTAFYLFNISITNWFDFVELSANVSKTISRPWTILSYGFFHGSFGHIFWNMVLLNLSGLLMLNLFKKTLLINTYFIGIIAGGLIYIISYNIFPVFNSVNASLIGSSAGVMAVLVFMASYMPNSPIRVFVFSVPLKYIALLFIFIDLIQIPQSNAGGHIAHLGGALWGYIYQRQYLKGNDIGYWFLKTYDGFRMILKSKKQYSQYKKRDNAKKQTKSIDQKKVDTILDKIADSGYESLTKSEKEYLFKAGND